VSERNTDQLLVARVQQGDQRAFGLLVTKYQKKVIHLVARFVYDAHLTEDISQDVFIRAYRALPSFRGDAAFYTWLYRITINTAKNHLITQDSGKNKCIKNTIDFDEVFTQCEALHEISTPEGILHSKQLARTVNQAIYSLSEELRSAIVLREIDGLSYEEIALSMQCSIGTVRSRIFRARELIAKRLRPLLDRQDNKRW